MSVEPIGELQTILTGAAFVPVANRAFLLITGSDATRWLNGMVTNSVQALQPGEGCYNFLLNAQGRIQGDCSIYRDPEAPEPTFVLETDREQVDTIYQTLDKFIIMDDVELTRREDLGPGVVLVGPRAPELLASFQQPSAEQKHTELGPLRLARNYSNAVQVTSPAAMLVPEYHLLTSSQVQHQSLTGLLTQAGAQEVTPESLEALRILEARPHYGTDIRNTELAKDLPQETNQPQALHFAKGCYLGQEIVERIRSRGQVHRLFTPFRLEGAPPSSFPAPLEANGKAAGEITSAASILTTEGPVWLALGYARREALDAKATFTYPGGTASPRTAGQLA